MKIVLFTPEYPPNCGGIGYYVYYLVRELINEGIECEIIVRGKRDRFCRDDGISVYEVGAPGIAPLNFFLIKKKTEYLLKKIGADILHIHSSSMPFIETELPVIVTAHWCLAEGTKIFYRPIKDLDAIYRNIMLPIYCHVERKLAQKCDVLTVVSQSMKKEFLEHHEVDSHVIWNGVDINKFYPGSVKKEKIVLYTGMFRIGKGIVDLISASEGVTRKITDLKFVLVGAGPLGKYMKKQIKKKNLENISIINHLPHSELIQYYKKSSIYVLPTYYEGLPTTVLEAMACGLPVVATNVSGIPDEIDDGINGFLIPPKEPNLLAKKICTLMEDQSLRDEMGKHGRDKVEKQFIWKYVAERLLNIYSGIR
ncbi:MAG: glycosyltransferase family 4 protein [Candidatus Hodarchaeota archaeon]